MRLSDFDYYLPPELIAQKPLEKRDSSRLLVLYRKEGKMEHSEFKDLPDILRARDLLVFNDTKVFPARLIGRKADTSSQVEVLLLRSSMSNLWRAMVRPGRRIRVGTKLLFGDGELVGDVVERYEDGTRLIDFKYEGDFEAVLNKLGEIPLPPYIKSPLEDEDRYQTVYATHRGSAAAPTAGLHFTEELLTKIEEKGIDRAFLTLHVGMGTFRPVRTEDITDHRMSTEYYEVGNEVAFKVNSTRSRGGRVIAVGTTTTRVLENLADEKGYIVPESGMTDLFIRPGYRFKVIDVLITNFHLPKSTLFILVCAFAGYDLARIAYEEAIKRQYRFYSFGDAMIIL